MPLPMSLKSRREYLVRIKPRYLKASKEEKSIMLDEYSKVTGLVRKYIIQILSAKVSDKDKQNHVRKKRKSIYGVSVVIKLKKLWQLMDYPCGLRMKPMMAEWIRKLKSFGEITLSEEVENKLLKISAPTIDRKLVKARKEEHRKIFSTTKPGTLLKNQIPIRTSSWEETQIGFCELDTVAHCGSSMAGLFAFTLNLVDILTGWDESETVLGKGEKGIVSALKNIEQRLPFPLRGIDPDNGGEFINYSMIEYCAENKTSFTRGRPYKKNDNAHIEQKNWTHIRKIFGYSRIEDEEIIKKMNELNRNEIRLYKNFFQANVKLIGSSDFPVGKPPKPVSAPTSTLPRMKDKKTYVGGRDSVSTIMISEFLSPSPSHACPSVYGIRGRVGVGGDTVANRLTHKKVGRTYKVNKVTTGTIKRGHLQIDLNAREISWQE